MDVPDVVSSNPFEDPEHVQPIDMEEQGERTELSPKEQSAEPDYDQADADLGPSTSVDPVAEGGEDCEIYSQEQEDDGEAELEQLEDEPIEPKEDPVLDRGDSAPLEPDASARYSPYVDPLEAEGAGEEVVDEEESSVDQPAAIEGAEHHHFAIQMGFRTITISPDLQDNFVDY